MLHYETTPLCEIQLPRKNNLGLLYQADKLLRPKLAKLLPENSLYCKKRGFLSMILKELALFMNLTACSTKHKMKGRIIYLLITSTKKLKKRSCRSGKLQGHCRI